ASRSRRQASSTPGAERREESGGPCAEKTRDVAENLVDATDGERMNEYGAAQVRGDGNGVRTSEGARAELRGGRRVEGDDVAFRAGGAEAGAQSRDRRRAVMAGRIEAVDRRDDARGAGPCGEERLRGVEYLR